MSIEKVQPGEALFLVRSRRVAAVPTKESVMYGLRDYTLATRTHTEVMTEGEFNAWWQKARKDDVILEIEAYRLNVPAQPICTKSTKASSRDAREAPLEAKLGIDGPYR